MDIDVDCASRSDLIAHIDRLEAKLMAFEAPGADERVAVLMEALGIERMPARLIEFLRDGRPRSKEAIWAFFYSDRPDDAPELNMISVLVCKARSAVWKYGIEIATIHGYGYRLAAGGDGLAAALAGAPVPVVRDAPRPVAQQSLARFGGAPTQISRVLAALKRRQAGARHGRSIAVSGRAIVEELNLKTTAAGFFRQLEADGLIEVITAGLPGRGLWTLRVTARGMAR